MDNERELLRRASQRILENDRELAEQVRGLQQDKGLLETASAVHEIIQKRSGVTGGLESMEAPDETIGLETIVQRVGRPVLLVQDNAYRIDDPRLMEPDSDIWKRRLFEPKVKKNLIGVIPAVGRVELEKNPDYEWVGTGWLIASDIIITNRHVASEFGYLRGDKFGFRPGFPNGTMSARLDFREEYERTAVSEFVVKDILYIAPEDGPDMALLKIEQASGKGSKLAGALRLSKNGSTEKQYVATIGYPAADSRVPDHDLVTKFFGDIYNKKRLAPGQILREADGLLFHDCSTLGGNSGSPVIDLATGAILGLHFSGLFLRENRGVTARVLAEVLDKVRHKTVPRPNGRTASSPEASNLQSSAQVVVSPISTDGSTISFQLQVPVEVKIALGIPSVVTPAGTAGSPGDVASAVRRVKETIGTDPNVLAVRKGYVFANGWITKSPAVVVIARDTEAGAAIRLPTEIQGVPVQVRAPSPTDLLPEEEMLLEGVRATSYKKPTDFELKEVEENMRVVCHVSPDAGWPTLKAFLARTKKRLTIGMYDFTAPQVVKGVLDAVSATPKELTLVLQQKEALGGKIKDEAGDVHETEVLSGFDKALRKRFHYAPASVGTNKQFASAYHIKVAVQDGKSFWLSSGNWQSTNQYHDAPEPNSTDWFFLKNLNREWHVVIDNENLAGQFEEYLNYDFKNAEADEAPARKPLFWEVEELAEEAPVGKPTYFLPLEVNRKVRVQPLLTPDNYQEETLVLIQSAKKQILFQNQSLNLQGTDRDGNDKNDPRFAELYNTLLAKQQAGLDVRIIMRGDFDPTGYLELLQGLGFDMSKVKVQNHCHTKGIIVDGKRVLLGSHNWTNEGTLVNRDASLIFSDPDIAAYYAKIFEFDWKNLARQSVGRPRRVRRVPDDEIEAPPRPGWHRVQSADLM